MADHEFAHLQSPRLAATPARVLEEDPDLGAGIDERELPLASRLCIAPAFRLERGPWRFFPEPDPAAFGALVLDGLIVVRIDAGARAHVELLGAGDVISPWAGTGPDLVVPSVVNATIVTELRLAFLDRGFATRTARWPEIHAALIQRVIARARRLSLQSAINALTRVEERLELTFWQLAARFGRVTSRGTVLQVRITHAQLADMVAAQRPSVTTALAHLEADRRLVCEPGYTWILPGSPPSKLSPLTRQIGLEA